VVLLERPLHFTVAGEVMMIEISEAILNSPKRILRPVARVFRHILGCRHSQMSRPYTVNDEPYRNCLECGARRRLENHSWTKQHAYYF
jgi:hypothetical protein